MQNWLNILQIEGIMKIDKIIITGDLLRPSPNGEKSAQLTNISWLYHVLKFPIESTFDNNIDVKMSRWEENGFDAKHFYNLNDLTSFPNDWISIYSKSIVSPESEKYFHSFFKDTFVIGFELPEVFINLFDKLEINYIDIIIHPVRYLDDLIFGFRTNSSIIYSNLKNFQLDPNQYKLLAGQHKASISRMPKLNLEDNSALFTGQVEVDKSLIKDGKCLSLLDFKEKFISLTKKYNKVYFKKHPYAKDNSKIDKFLKRFENVEYIDENFYYILGQEEIKSVYSISSSTVLEALQWDKTSSYFYKNPFELSRFEENNFSNKEYISIDQLYLTEEFWQVLFNKKEYIQDNYKTNIPNKFRKSLNNLWGYDFFDNTNLTNNNTIDDVILSLQPNVQSLRKHLLQNKNNKNSRFFNIYLKSSFFEYIKVIKKVLILEKSLLWFKHKVLKWDK